MFKIFVYFFFAYFYPKTWWTIQKCGNFYYLFFSKVQIWVLGVTFFCSFWLLFYPLDPDPWIRIFLRIRIQEAKILRIQRIRILSTGRSPACSSLKPRPQAKYFNLLPSVISFSPFYPSRWKATSNIPSKLH